MQWSEGSKIEPGWPNRTRPNIKFEQKVSWLQSFFISMFDLWNINCVWRNFHQFYWHLINLPLRTQNSEKPSGWRMMDDIFLKSDISFLWGSPVGIHITEWCIVSSWAVGKPQQDTATMYYNNTVHSCCSAMLTLHSTASYRVHTLIKNSGVTQTLDSIVFNSRQPNLNPSLNVLNFQVQNRPPPPPTPLVHTKTTIIIW